MESGNNGVNIDTNVKLDIKNIALKAPKKSRYRSSDSFWRVFWISNIPKRECISEIRKEYSQIIENMQD